MAIKASSSITLSSVVDVKATYRYYLLQSSTLTAPSKPTTYPPASTWDDTEPTYTDGSTNSLYFVDCTVFSDDTFSYSEVSLSSSYEAAKQAYNKAVNAQNGVNNLTTRVTNAETSIKSNKEAIELRATKEEVTEQLIYRDPVGIASGKPSVRIDDISSVKHVMKTKLSGQLVPAVNIKAYGKNLIPYPYRDTTKTVSGVTFTDNGDGTITVNGTATAAAYFVLAHWSAFVLSVGQYCLSGNPVPGTQVYLINEDSSLYKYDSGWDIAVFDNQTTQNVMIAIMIPNGMTVDNAVYKPQLELGSKATEYEPYKEPVTYYCNEDGSVNDVKSVYPTVTLVPNTPYVTVDCEYYKDNVLGDEMGSNDNLEERILSNEESIASLTVDANRIVAEVQKNTTLINESKDGLDARLKEVEKKASVSVTHEQVKIAIETELSENGAGKLKTKTGYTFDDDGMMVHKSDSEMKTQVSDNGMTVYQRTGAEINEETGEEEALFVETLKANNEGVVARNLNASTYLIFAEGRGRFQKYDKNGEKRIACYWLGG